MRVVVGQSRVRREDETSLVVRVGAISSEDARGRLEAAVTVSIADAQLARTMTRAIADALTAAGGSSWTPRTVHLRTRKRLALLVAHHAAELTGAVAIVKVTGGNARHLLELVDGLRAAGVLGVQMVWNGVDPERSRAERHVFAVLERARSLPHLPSVILASTAEPMEALRMITANKRDDRS